MLQKLLEPRRGSVPNFQPNIFPPVSWIYLHNLFARSSFVTPEDYVLEYHPSTGTYVITSLGDQPEWFRHGFTRNFARNVNELSARLPYSAFLQRPQLPLEQLDWFRPTFDPWDVIRGKLAAFRTLHSNWDSHGAEEIPEQTLRNAELVIDGISELGGGADWVEPTSESSIVLQSRFGHYVLTLEIDASDEVGVAVICPNAEPLYRDIDISDLPSFVLENVNGAR
jgi:hypothetical protein